MNKKCVVCQKFFTFGEKKINNDDGNLIHEICPLSPIKSMPNLNISSVNSNNGYNHGKCCNCGKFFGSGEQKEIEENGNYRHLGACPKSPIKESQSPSNSLNPNQKYNSPLQDNKDGKKCFICGNFFKFGEPKEFNESGMIKHIGNCSSHASPEKLTPPKQILSKRCINCNQFIKSNEKNECTDNGSFIHMGRCPQTTAEKTARISAEKEMNDTAIVAEMAAANQKKKEEEERRLKDKLDKEADERADNCVSQFSHYSNKLKSTVRSLYGRGVKDNVDEYEIILKTVLDFRNFLVNSITDNEYLDNSNVMKENLQKVYSDEIRCMEIQALEEYIAYLDCHIEIGQSYLDEIDEIADKTVPGYYNYPNKLRSVVRGLYTSNARLSTYSFHSALKQVRQFRDFVSDSISEKSDKDSSNVDVLFRYSDELKNINIEEYISYLDYHIEKGQFYLDEVERNEIDRVNWHHDGVFLFHGWYKTELNIKYYNEYSNYDDMWTCCSRSGLNAYGCQRLQCT